MAEITLSLPLNIEISKSGKKFAMNLNNYRNTHYQTLNKAKKVYRDMVWDAFINASRNGGDSLQPPFSMVYTVYPPTKRKCDVANICSIVDKFACDALVELRLMDDDDYTHVPVVIYQFGKVDRENPRCELHIKQLGG